MDFNWNLGADEEDCVAEIVDRAFELYAEHDIQAGEKIDLRIDLIATHNHACHLNLVKMLKAPDFDFMHDIIGIRRHLNRETGQLGNHFIPRCAMG